MGFPGGSAVRNQPAKLETCVRSLGPEEDPLEKKMATHSSILAWEIPRTDKPDRLQSSSVQSLSHTRLFATPCTAARQASLSITNFQSLLKLRSVTNWWYHPTISSSVVPFSSCLQSFLASRFFQWVSSSHQVAKGLEFQLQHQSFQWIFRSDFLYDGLVRSPCSPRDSQESSPTPQFKASIFQHSVSLSPTLTTIRDYGKNNSFD